MGSGTMMSPIYGEDGIGVRSVLPLKQEIQ